MEAAASVSRKKSFNGDRDVKNRKEDDDESNCQIAESDPSGRYIRYNEILGKGAHKTVYRGFDEMDGIEVAWNQVKLQDVLDRPGDLERLYSEIHLLKTLKHKHIIEFYHSWVDPKMNRINFITEFFTSGTLRQYCKRHKRIDIKAVKRWCRQILKGLMYLHSHHPPIVHRDLKCDNIFINGNKGEVKIGDLGFASVLYHMNSSQKLIGTPEFMAPELYEEEYNELVDIYAFGMCLLEMVTFDYPYSECRSAAQIYKRVISGIKPAALDKLKDPELRRFVEKCLATASNRLPARDLLMDPFLQTDDVCISSFTNMESQEVEKEISSNALNAMNPSDAAETSFSVYENIVQSVGVSRLMEAKSVPNVAFQLKGKRRENQLVYLSLRMTTEGKLRIIHFPFDLEVDTAMCVASEMVEELALADQDVTKVAEMIDAAVLEMVPEWNPGVAIDERFDNEEDPDETSAHGCQYSIWSDVTTMSSDSFFTGQSQSVTSASLGSAQKENAVHGRFEEITYHACKVEHDNFTNKFLALTGSYREAQKSNDESNSPVAKPISICKGLSRMMYAFDAAHQEPDDVSTCNYIPVSSNHNCIDSSWHKVMGDCVKYEGVGFGRFSKMKSKNIEENELLLHQIRNLTLQYKRDLDGLRQEHENAVLQLKKLWKVKRFACSDGEMETVHLPVENQVANASMQEFAIGNKEGEMNIAGQNEFSVKFLRSNATQRSQHSNRLSFKELTSLLSSEGLCR